MIHDNLRLANSAYPLARRHLHHVMAYLPHFVSFLACSHKSWSCLMLAVTLLQTHLQPLLVLWGRNIDHNSSIRSPPLSRIYHIPCRPKKEPPPPLFFSFFFFWNNITTPHHSRWTLWRWKDLVFANVVCTLCVTFAWLLHPHTL